MKMPDDLWKFSCRSTRVLKHNVIITAGFVLPLISLRFISDQPLKLGPTRMQRSTDFYRKAGVSLRTSPQAWGYNLSSEIQLLRDQTVDKRAPQSHRT